MSNENVVRVGVLGAGAWARGAHLPGYRRDPRCRLVAIADTEIDRAREAAREFDIPVAVADARELLTRDDIDMVDVCTPSHTHFDNGRRRGDKHVLCESRSRSLPGYATRAALAQQTQTRKPLHLPL
jgi:predicted dehydrogenase